MFPISLLRTTGSSVAAPTRRRSTRRDGAHRAHQVAPRALLARADSTGEHAARGAGQRAVPPFSHAFPPCACMSAFPLPFRLAHAFPPSPCLSAFPMPFRLAHAFPPCACLSALRMPFRLSHAFPPCACLSPSAHAVLPAMPFPLCSCRSPCPCLSPSAHALPPLPMLCPVCSCRPFRHVREMAGEGVATSIELTNCRPRHGPADVATSADVACSLDRRLAMPP
ncbi:unnamed protein product [Closterium sp. Naga37s-1]|nr:unnamed protein product [Closterium sp. Naga37s-1]